MNSESENEYNKFINSLGNKYKIKINKKYIDVKIKRDCYCFEFDDSDDENEKESKLMNELAPSKNIKYVNIIIRIHRDKNKNYIEGDDIINELNKKQYKFLYCNHKFLEVVEKDKNNNYYITWFGS